jgi:hypothetical protein
MTLPPDQRSLGCDGVGSFPPRMLAVVSVAVVGIGVLAGVVTVALKF